MIHRLIIYISILFFCISSAAQAQPDSGAQIVEAAARYDAGDYRSAESILRKVLTEDPKNDAALYYMAMCSLAQKQTDEAEEYLSLAIDTDSSNYWYRYKLASIYAATRRPELAIDMYEKLLGDFPKKNELYFELVELYAATGENEKALKTIKEVETVFGMTESIAIYRYNLLLKMDRREDAYKSLEEYNSKYSSPFVLAALAEHQISMYNDSTALAYYDEALEMSPDFSPALLGKAETLRMTRKYDDYFQVVGEYVSSPDESSKAKADYIGAVLRGTDPRFVKNFSHKFDSVMTKLSQVHPSDSVVLNLAGLYYYTTGRPDMAGNCFRENAEAYPESLSAVSGYVEYLMYAGRWEDLSKAGRDAYLKFPSELAFVEMASIGDYNLKDYDKVLALCDEIIETAPSDSAKTLRAWSTKGDVFHMTGEPKKAYKAYEKALKVNPGYVYVLNNYAYYLSMEGKNLKKAYEMSRKTIEAEPDNATYLDTFGWILYLMGKPEEAKTHFKRAMLYGGKDSVVILDHYAEVLFALGEYDRAMVYWNKALKNNKGEVKDLEERINMRKQQKKAK